MMDERERKARVKIITIFATVDEITFGAYQLSALLLLYNSFYIPTMIYNCQSWTNLIAKDLTRLSTLQMRYLKKMLRVPQSTSNSFVLLELGLLPIEHEIFRRQFTFLHHILRLDHDDPVWLMYHQMKTLPYQRNWANTLLKRREMYGISLDDNKLKDLSVHAFKNLVNTKVRETVFQELVQDCKNKSKTLHLSYTSFHQQSYLTRTPPHLTYLIIRMRCNMLNTIHNRPYMFPGGNKCRACGIGNECLSHIVNCCVVSHTITKLDEGMLYSDDPDINYLEETAETVAKYLEMAEMDG